MTDHSSLLSDFDAEWQKAVHQQDDLQVVEVDDIVIDSSVEPLLQRLSRLADTLNHQNIIDSDQRDQVKQAIVEIEEVTRTVNPKTLSDVLKRLN